MQIKYNQHGRNKLADDSSPCTALDSPFETKDKQWVKNCVDDRSDQSADHRISGTAVSTNQVVAPTDKVKNGSPIAIMPT